MPGCDWCADGSLHQHVLYVRMPMSPGHACPQRNFISSTKSLSLLGQWLHDQRSSFKKGSLSTGKVAALKAVGVEFDGRKAQAIREQHEALLIAGNSQQAPGALFCAHNKRQKRLLANVGADAESTAKRSCIRALHARALHARCGMMARLGLERVPVIPL